MLGKVTLNKVHNDGTVVLDVVIEAKDWLKKARKRLALSFLDDELVCIQEDLNTTQKIRATTRRLPVCAA